MRINDYGRNLRKRKQYVLQPDLLMVGGGYRTVKKDTKYNTVPSCESISRNLPPRFHACPYICQHTPIQAQSVQTCM